MADKRAHSPDVDEELDADSGAIISVKKQRTDEGAIVVGSVTKEVGALPHVLEHVLP